VWNTYATLILPLVVSIDDIEFSIPMSIDLEFDMLVSVASKESQQHYVIAMLWVLQGAKT
jgi:hypothetical protein